MADCLLIDDSRLARRICRAELEARGFSVTEAGDGAEGLARMQEQDFALILVDQFMPVMTGLEFLAALSSRSTSTAHVLLCSSDATPELVERALTLGADGYLNKPYTPGALDRQLARLQFAPK